MCDRLVCPSPACRDGLRHTTSYSSPVETGYGEEAPDEFRVALDSIGAHAVRREVRLRETPAPARIAPYAVALLGDVEDDLASGRFVVLHDPDGQDSWRGRFRVVTLTRALLEPEMATDDLLSEVAWSWLEDALDLADARAELLGGTITRLASQSFGELADRPTELELEIRASWTPTGTDFGAHLEAWTSLLCTAAGLPPLPDGVTPLPRRRNTVNP